MLGQESKCRTETVPVHKLDDRNQLLQAILQRCPGENDCVRRSKAFNGSSRARVPVLDSLSLVQYYGIGRPSSDQIKIAMEGIVVGDLIERAGREQLLPPGA